MRWFGNFFGRESVISWSPLFGNVHKVDTRMRKNQDVKS